MLEFEGINYLAIVVAWLVAVGVGSYWYSPAGFGKQWSKLSGVDIMKLPKDEASRSIMFVALSAVVQVVTLALVLNSLEVKDALNGLIVGLVLWLGFTAATTVGTTLYQRKGWKFLWLNSSYFLVVMTINSIILAIW